MTYALNHKSLPPHFDRMFDAKLLTADEEVELARRVHLGDDQALEKLLKANIRFVYTVARQFEGQGLPLADLISEGNIGLIRAARRFDETRGFKFISYAVWWIRQSIQQALVDQTRTVRLPANRHREHQEISRSISGLEQELGREPSIDEVASTVGKKSRAVSTSLMNSVSPVYLDAPSMRDEGGSALEYIADSNASLPDEEIMSSSLRIDLEIMMQELKPREASILRKLFGFDSGQAMTLSEVGEELGITRERVRQIKEVALERLRQRNQLAVLENYLNG